LSLFDDTLDMLYQASEDIKLIQIKPSTLTIYLLKKSLKTHTLDLTSQLTQVSSQDDDKENVPTMNKGKRYYTYKLYNYVNMNSRDRWLIC
jgi:hypothetical protein